MTESTKSTKSTQSIEEKMAEDSFVLGGHTFHSRFILGSGKYSLELIDAAVRYAEAELVTVAVRRANTKEKENILDYVPKTVTLLPNTSGARTAEEAVRIAHLAKALGCGDFIKIEIMRDSKYLLPDNNETIRATEMLAKEGFVVLPYMYPDLYAARALVDAGAAAVMPLAAPIGAHKGLATKELLQILIDEIALPIIVDITVKSNTSTGALTVSSVTKTRPDGTAANGFTNAYHATGEFAISTRKELAGRALKDGEFSFELLDSSGKVIDTRKNTADGTVAFGKISVNEASIGKTLKYTIREKNGSLGGVTYDTKEIPVSVKVTDNGDGTLTGNVTYPSGDAGKFKMQLVSMGRYFKKWGCGKGKV